MLIPLVTSGFKGYTKRRDLDAAFVSPVGAAGFEPTTSSTPLKRATKLRHAPNRWHFNRVPRAKQLRLISRLCPK